MTDVDKLGRRIAELEEKLEALMRNGIGLGHSSFDDGAMTQFTGGVIGGTFGTQFDGSNGAVALNGPVPPTPRWTSEYGAAIAPAPLGALIRWEGRFEPDDLVTATLDHKEVEVHVSEDPNFAADTFDTMKGTITSARGGQVLLSLPVTETGYYARLVSRTNAGRRSAASKVIGPFTTQKIRTEDLGFALEDLGGNTISRGPDEPEGPIYGDLWLKTPGNIAYRFEPPDPGTWNMVRDQGVVEAINTAIDAQSSANAAGLSAADANTLANAAKDSAATAQAKADQASQDAAAANGLAVLAQSAADGKVTVYRQASTPTGGTYRANDLWIGTTGLLFAWSGSAWVAVDDQRIATALTTANGKTTVFAQISQPATTGRTLGDLWIDTDDSNKQYVWDGAWTVRPIGAAAISATARQLGAFTIYRQTSAPTTGVLDGDYWIDSSASGGNKAYLRASGAWAAVQDTSITTALNNAATAQATADGKARVFTQTSAPTGLVAGDIGDIWINPAEGNRSYIWSNAASVQRTNLLTNPSFELTTAGWSGYNGSTVATSTAQAASGTSSLLITMAAASGGLNQGAGITLTGLTVGTTYTFSASVYVPTGSTAAAVSLWVNGTAVASSTVTTAGSWQRRSVTWQATATSHTVSLFNNAATTAGMTAYLDAAMLEQAATMGTYFDGSTGGEARWTGTQNGSTSTTWAQVTGSYAWQPNLLRSAAIQPNSIIAKDVIATGTVSAALLEAILVLANVIIAGDPNGNHARMTATGFAVYVPSPMAGQPPYVAVSMGNPTSRDTFGVADDAGNLLANIDETGASTFRTVNAQEDVIVRGRSIVNDLLAARPRGVVGWGVGTPDLSGIVAETQLFSITWNAEASRIYRVIISGLRWANTSVGLGNGAVFILRDAAQGGKELGRAELQSGVNANSGHSFIVEIPQPLAVGQHVFVLSVAAAGSAVTAQFSGDNPYRMSIEDVGPVIEYTGRTLAIAAPTPTLTTYQDTVYASWGQAYKGDGSPMSNSGGKLYQGTDPSGYNGNQASLLGFPDLTARLAGAKINSIDLFIYAAHWYNNAGGTAVIGAHALADQPGSFAGTIDPGRMQIGGWARATGRSIDLTSWAAEFKAGSVRGIVLGPGPSGAAEYYGYFNGPGQAYFPELHINYTK